jgi:acetyltransferase
LPNPLDRALNPKSVAVIGASERGLGAVALSNVIRGFPGDVYPVNRRQTELMGLKAYPSIDDVPVVVDLALVLVPAVGVPDVAGRCRDLGVGGLLVCSAGFAEAGDDGVLAQQALSRLNDGGNFPIIGPNCNGFVNNHANVRATFAVYAETGIPKGGVALVSQSGGFGAYILLKAMNCGLGLAWYFTTGNEADVDAAHALRYLVERDEVKILLTYLEGIRSPEVLVEAARRAAELDKPLVVVKAGSTEAGSRAALSHTASVAGSGAVYEAVCEQYGVLRASSVEQMLDYAVALQTGRRMSGSRLGVLTPSGGAGVLMADEASYVGLTVPPLPEADQLRIAALLPSFATATNPIDMTGGSTVTNGVPNPNMLGDVLNEVTTSSGVDAILPLVWSVGPDEERAVRTAYAGTDKPMVIATTLEAPQLTEAGIPVFGDPARAVRALGAVFAVSMPVPGLETVEVVPDSQRAGQVRELLASAAGQPFILESLAKQILRRYDIPVSEEAIAHSSREAVAIAAGIEGPVALKGLSYQLAHKSDSGAIRLGLRGADEVSAAYDDLLAEMERSENAISVEGILVQEMVPATVEMACGLQRDPLFGPMVIVGLGGSLIEILAGTSMLKAPFSTTAATRAIESLWQGRLTATARGLNKAQVGLIAEIMVAIGQLAVELPEVASIDINPIRVSGPTLKAVDALLLVDWAVPELGSSRSALAP